MSSHSELLDARHAETVTRLAHVERQLAELRGIRLGESDDDEHDPEGAPLSVEWSRLEGLRQAYQQELTGIVSALERVAAGTADVCEVCGTTIPAERRAVRPDATRCVACASI
ncbi:MAG: TraR/DksA family transcriptional regulator [Mycetocola sp.]